MNKASHKVFRARLRDKLMRTLGISQEVADMAGDAPRTNSLDFFDFETQNPDGERSGSLDFMYTQMGYPRNNNQGKVKRVRRV